MITSKLFRVGSLLLVLLFALSVSAFGQVTIYVNNNGGVDARTGQNNNVSDNINGPVGTISRAVILASAGDTISVAFTGVPYAEPGVTPATTANFIKKVVVIGTGGAPEISATVEINPTGTNTVTFVSAFTISGNLNLTSGAVVGGGNLTLASSILITRTAGTIDVAPTFGTTVNVTYSPGAAMTIGPELPTTATVLSALQLTTAQTLTVNRSIQMKGILTLAAGTLALGSNTLTITSSAAGPWTHDIRGSITASATGGLSFSLTGTSGSNDVNIDRTTAGGLVLPGVTVSAVTAGQDVTFGSTANVTSVTIGTGTNAGSLTNNGVGSVVSSATAGLVTVNGSVSNTSSGNIGFGAAGTVTGNVSNSGSLTVTSATSNRANIAFAGVATISGSVTNSATISASAGSGVTHTNLGKIVFSAAASIDGNVTNSPVITASTTNSGATAVNDIGNITFADAAHTILGFLLNQSTQNGGSITTVVPTNLGNISFANTGTAVVIEGAVTNSSTGFANSGSTSGSQQSNSGRIIFTARAAGTVTIGLTTANANLTNSSSNTDSDNGNIDLTAAATGAVIVHGSVLQSGSAGTGDIIFGLGDVTVDVGVSITRSVTGAVVTIAADGGAAHAHSLGAVSITGGSKSSFTIGALTNAGSTVSLTTLTISAGTFGPGTGASVATVTISNTITATGGAIDFGTAARTVNVTGQATNINGVSFSNSGLTTLKFNRSASAQSLTAGANTVFPGFLEIANGYVLAPVFTFPSGNFTVKGAKFTDNGTTTDGVDLGSARLIITGNAAAFGGADFRNDEGFTATSGVVSIQGSAAQVVAGIGNFGAIEVNNAAGATFGTGAAETSTITGTFYLTLGAVGTGAGDAIAFNNTTTPPTIVRSGGSFTGAPTFTTKVSVVYTGTASIATASELPGAAGKLFNLSVFTSSGSQTVTLDKSCQVDGTLTVNSGQTLAIATWTLTVNGASYVNNGTTTNTTGVTVLKKAAGTAVTGAGLLTTMQVANSSTGNTITGSVGLGDNGGAAGTGSLTVLGGGTSGAITLTFAALTTNAAHVAALTTNDDKNTVTLGAALAVGTNLVDNAGTIALGANNLTVGTATPTPAHVVGSTAVFTSTTGSLVFTNSAAGNGTLTAATAAAAIGVPVVLNNAVATDKLSLAGFAFTFSNNVTLTRGQLDLGQNLTLTGNALSLTANSSISSAGVLDFAPTAGALVVTLGGATTFDNMTIDGDVTLAGTTGDLTVTTSITHNSGLLTFADRNILTATFTRTGGTYAATTGSLELTTALTQGTGMSIPNLTIDGTFTLGTAQAMTVTGILHLKSGTLTHTVGGTARMHLAAGGTVQITAGTTDVVATYDGTFNLSYTIPAATVVTGIEWPSSANPSTLTLNGANSATSILQLAGSRTVGTAVVLTQGVLDLNGKTLTLANNLVLSITGNASVTLVTANSAFAYSGTIDVTYTGTVAIAATGDELPTSTTVLRNLTFTRTGNVVNFLTTNGKSITVNGTLAIRNDLTTTGTINALGDVNIATDAGTNATAPVTTFTAALKFGGAADQTFTLNGNRTVTNMTVNKTSATAAVTVSGGDLTVSTLVTFVNGLLKTGATNSIILGANPGYDRSGVTGTNSGHVVGNVQRSIAAIGRYEFPVGSAGTSPKYRSMTITFQTAPIIASKITIGHFDAAPGGTVNLPLDGGAGVMIGSASPYYWLATADPALGAGQAIDVELVGTNLNAPFANANQLRIIRRFDGSVDVNGWTLQGDGTKYSNFMSIPSVVDTVLTIRNLGAMGSLVTQAARFAIGIPTQKPSFTAIGAVILPDTSVNENSTLSFIYNAVNPNLGDPTAYSLAVTPALSPSTATINATTGALAFTPNYSQSGVYTFVVTATNSTGSTSTTAHVTVVNVNRAPVFSPKTVAATVKDGDTLKVAMAATDADGNTLTYSFLDATPAVTNAPAVSGSTLSWVATFAEAGTSYALRALVSDGVTTGQGPNPGTDTLTVNVAVSHSRARGDVDGNGSVQAADASLVLKHVAGITLITNPSALFAADASNNGSITAYDAALILQAAAGLITLPATNDAKATLAKEVAVAGTLNWSSPEVTSDPAVLSVGLKLANAANVYAAQLTSTADFSALSIEGVSAALPEGWQMQWNVSGNELRIAMAGITPLSSGDIATLTVRLKNKESRLNFSTDALLNENFQSLGAVEIAAVPTVFALEQNYPNPFNPSTTIKYQIPADANVNLVIYNVQGQQIRTLIAKEQKAGYYNVVWDGRNEAGQTVSSGLYLYRVQAGSFVATHKMLMIK